MYVRRALVTQRELPVMILQQAKRFYEGAHMHGRVEVKTGFFLAQ